jgi:beta-lactamase regulating signal transducer with metallopeptidase domain
MISSPSLAAELLDASCRGAVIILALLVLRFFLRKHVPARIIAAGWVLAALVWLIPWTLPVVWSPLPPMTPASSDTALAEVETLPEMSVASRLSPLADTTTIAPADAAKAVSNPPKAPSSPGLIPILTAVWLLVAGTLIAGRVVNAFILHRRVTRSAIPTPPRLLHALQALTNELNLPRPPAIVVSSMVSSPALFGLWRPSILFPPTLAERLSDSELRWVLLHELGHYQRKDLWSLSLLHLATAVHWFNPLAWIALHFGRIDAEIACDELVLSRQSHDAPEGYGAVLLKVLGAQSSAPPASTALGIVEDKRQLTNRLIQIMNFKRTGFVRLASSIAVLSGLAVVGFTQEKASPTPATTADQAATATPASSAKKNHDATNPNPRLAEAIAWEENVKLELRAVGEVGGVPVAIVDLEGEPIVVTPNIGIRSLRVTAFLPTANEITVTTRSGTKRVLKLDNPSPVEFPKVDPNWFLTPEAIARRQENQRHEKIPGAIVLSWSKINRAGKEAILMNYLRAGEIVQVLETTSGGYSTSSAFLFAEKLAAIRREKQQVFLASLTPEQRTKFGSGAAAAVRFTDSAVKVQEQMQRGKEAAARREEVVASLTPEQKKLYDEWMGPTSK